MSADAGRTRAAADETHLREVVRELVAESSLRKVAREIGISPPGLRGFLKGTSPMTTTLEKLRAWHFKGAGVDAMPVETVRSALHVLVGGLPQPERSAVAREILGMIGEAHREEGNARPAWLVQLHEEYADAR